MYLLIIYLTIMKKNLQKIFKKISYSIFLLLYGSIKHSINHKENSKIKIKTININSEKNYKVYNIENGRLYTDRIHDTAVILDKKIIDGPSFQYRPGITPTIINSKISDNIVFTKGTPRFLRNLKGKVLSLLTGGAGNNNYWHWMYDVLPKLNLCGKYIKLEDIDFFLAPSLEKKFQKETLNLLNIPDHKIISSEKFRHIKANELIITDHPVVLNGNATQGMQNIPSWINAWLKDSFLKTSEKGNKKIKIYIDRDDASKKHPSKRFISNEEELKKNLLRNNFIIAKLHNMNIKDQINLFYNAECVVGLHGAGFTNIVFCEPQTKIIEIKSLGAGDLFKNLALDTKLNYNSLDIESKEIDKAEFKNQQGSIYVPINKFLQKLKE